jgi:hypothetical protein
MKRLPVLLMMSIVATAGSIGSAASATKKAPPKQPAAERSLDPAKGRFHQIHTKQLGMTCNTCHSPGTRDTWFLRRDDVVPAAMPGQVDRKLCIGCHTAPAKPAWYGVPQR